jgi:hypothetical protein
VFFGKVISVGASVAYSFYSDAKNIGDQPSYSFQYNVHLNSRNISSLKFEIQKKFNRSVILHNPFDTRHHEFKINRGDYSWYFAMTKDGTDRPFSAFFNVDLGLSWGRVRVMDSNYQVIKDEKFTKAVIGPGIALFQHIGTRFMGFFQSNYHIDVRDSHDVLIYFENEKKFKVTALDAHAGIIFLIGKTAE